MKFFLNHVASLHEISPLVVFDEDGSPNYKDVGWHIFKMCAYVEKSSRTYGKWVELSRPLLDINGVTLSEEDRKVRSDHLHEIIYRIGVARFYYKEAKVIQPLSSFYMNMRQCRYEFSFF